MQKQNFYKNKNNKNNKNKNKNTKIKEANARINNIQQELKDVKKKVMVERKINSGYIAQIPKVNLSKWNVQMLQNHYYGSIVNYLQALLNPELCVQGSLTAKQPNFTPIPTTTVTFKEQFSFNTDTNGEFKLVWVPNFLSNYSRLKEHCDKLIKETQTAQQVQMEYYAYSHMYLYQPTKPGNRTFLFHSSYLPNISLTKYRLVSAKLSVEYVGPKIQKGGMMVSSATYKDLPVVVQGSNAVINENFNFLNAGTEINPKFSEIPSLFDQENINNGLWNKYVNVSGKGVKLDNIALPTDPTDATFFPMTHYYASEPKWANDQKTASVSFVEGIGTSSDGGHLSYVVSGSGLHGSENQGGAPINIFVYYNFEVIAAQDTAPFLRTQDNKEQPKLLEILDNNKTKLTNFLVSENQKTRLDPSTSMPGIKRFASAMVREIAKFGFNMLPGTSFFKGNIPLPFK